MAALEKIKEYLSAWKRIILLSRRPDEEEFNLLTRLSLLGFVIVGAIGYIIHLIYVLLIA
ncbi:protein translocase SEC61 complex gamma subunit, archaeal and eukaryotic [Caldisphaera lagunensis DSM 15908]|uniref:Protein translocase subunit SecE n=1 Tax=Caldisphaera lagunensis (strain DSM 15908 / JCM 11604 / ANMR 0165 / IC-154) TaxID=1056495 RepID=L0AB53_CALLD|nr:protein translocase SEC61 complex subunit gamma [Caldisphaera lagunensis]AFZ70280.1 protein translocase SEC61 complex gamma subunit, archaeal and eukaryotic [Caldisphaera lagunensis DSM 15908]